MITITFAEDFDRPEHTAKQLAEWYNANCSEMDKSMPHNGLRTKALTINACKRLMKAIDDQMEMEEETKDMSDEEFKALMMGGIVAEDDEPKAKKSERDENVRRASNSDGISASWRDESIKKARTTRNKVQVEWKGGKEVFRSAGAAFAALGLPNSKCIRFRLKLKASGAETFEHNGDKYNFTLVRGMSDGPYNSHE